MFNSLIWPDKHNKVYTFVGCHFDKNMNIVIDTNIFRRDLKLKDKNFDILFDYLEKTNSKVILPKIVYEETIGLYERLIKERIDDYNKSLTKLNGTFINSKIESDSKINIEFEKSEYENFLKDKLKLSDNSIVPYKNEYLQELVNRAIQRIKPLDGKGQQFRDGLLWLTLLDIADLLDEKRIVFISDNSSDFGEKGVNTLSSELKEETNKRNIEVNYYKSISDFAKEHAVKVSFITSKWINDNIDFKQIENIFNQIISVEKDHIRKFHESSLDSNENATGYINETSYINSSVEEFFVYEMTDGRILLNIEFQFEKEYEMEIEKEVENDRSDYEYQYNINPRTGEMEYELVFVARVDDDIETNYKIIYPLFRAQFIITIKDKKVINYDFKEWDWG